MNIFALWLGSIILQQLLPISKFITQDVFLQHDNPRPNSPSILHERWLSWPGCCQMPCSKHGLPLYPIGLGKNCWITQLQYWCPIYGHVSGSRADKHPPQDLSFLGSWNHLLFFLWDLVGFRMKMPKKPIFECLCPRSFILFNFRVVGNMPNPISYIIIQLLFVFCSWLP